MGDSRSRLLDLLAGGIPPLKLLQTAMGSVTPLDPPANNQPFKDAEMVSQHLFEAGHSTDEILQMFSEGGSIGRTMDPSTRDAILRQIIESGRATDSVNGADRILNQ